jgi:hypothetical protein
MTRQIVIVYCRDGWRQLGPIVECSVPDDGNFMQNAKQAVRACDPNEKLRASGYTPDIIGAHVLGKQGEKWGYLTFNKGWE